MNRLLLVIFILFGALSITGCEKVTAGNVGIKVDLLGSEKGVDHQELGVGRYWIGVNEELYVFPTFTQNYTWTKNRAEGSPNDESISFQTVEGLSVNGDIGISYHIDPTKVSTVFQKYRRGVDEITDTFLRNMVRDALVTHGSTKEVASVYGAGKAELMKQVQASVTAEVEDIGIVIEKLYWVGDLRLPPSVIAAIDAKIGATQKAQQRENEVAQAKAEADKVIEVARGESESTRIRAEGEAQAIELRAKALARNPAIIQLNAIEKWDGKLPTYMSDENLPFIGKPAGK